MIPAILALAQLAPAVVGLFSNDKKAAKAARIVSDTAQIITGTSSPNEALAALKADPGAMLQYQQQMNAHTAAMYAESAETVRTEMQGESWLQRNWRPVTMLTFLALIVAKWFGFSVEGITPEVELAVFDIIKIGLGGYVIGRSAEKGIRAWRQQ